MKYRGHEMNYLSSKHNQITRDEIALLIGRLELVVFNDNETSKPNQTFHYI